MNFKDYLIIGHDAERENVKWLTGEWDNEPDFVKWKYQGVNCYINRAFPAGYLRGYIQIPTHHPLYIKVGKGKWSHSTDKWANFGFLDFPWGVTYLGRPTRSEFHEARLDKESRLKLGDELVAGFDCCHIHMFRDLRIENRINVCCTDNYYNFSLLKRICQNGVDQLLEVKEKKSISQEDALNNFFGNAALDFSGEIK